jgi:hypothetical protein
LLLRLVKAGQRALGEERERQRERRLAAVERTAGALTGVYPPGYLEQLCREWPD